MGVSRRAVVRMVWAFVALAALPASAAAHIERPSYWPEPAPDRSVTPAAGGKVPAPRSLGSALIRSRPGNTHVVCQPDSLTRLQASIAKARRQGYEIRPTDRRRFSVAHARRLLRINRRLKALCKYREIQPAVNAARNNDRVVVMPGLYTEPTARAQPTHDPKCDRYEIPTEFGDPGALSYAYHVNCPNDQSLVTVLGRGLGPGTDPPARRNRHGIPNLGPCLRCNLQLEGSGVSADDVIVDAGDTTKGNKGPSGVGAKKDVAIKADRADGFVLRNITARHAAEHGIYVLETDGYRLERFKAFYSRLYGTLTFADDHGLHTDCETVGHGDSGIYPGGAVESGVQRPVGTPFRYNQAVTRCDMHHNLAGYSGTNGNAVHIYRNEIYGNALGIQTDVVTGAGHPGYPGDSMLVENNKIYSNNFNPYLPSSDVHTAFPFPVGTGMWIAGGNHHVIRSNHVYDNWRRGFMLFTVPDTLICGPQTNNRDQEGCDDSKVSTSHYNSYYDNFMGVSPDGQAKPNGLDFWWDAFPGSRGNCWYRNRGPRPITSSPAVPNCDDGKDPASSMGTGYPPNEGELLGCLVSFETKQYDPAFCPWFNSPPRPGTAASARAQTAQRQDFAQTLRRFCESGLGPKPTCEPFRSYFGTW